MNEAKAALRRQILADTDALPAEYIAESNAGIFEQLKELPEFQSARTIFTYYSLGREPDTHKIIDLALSLGKTVTLPVCFKGGVMEARAISDVKELVCSAHDLMEPLQSARVFKPEELDFLIVPAVTYDVAGYRIGRGGGYYDRFLCLTRGFSAGLAREVLLMDAVIREAHDRAVACVVTEKKARLPGGASR